MSGWATGILLGYVLGSVPFGLGVGLLWKGVDITKHGSGNIGFTNTFRVLGPLPGAVVLLLDVGKGAAAAHLGASLGGTELAALLAGGASVVGHSWSFLLRFRGGRGVATAAGAFGYLAPIPVALCFAAWGLLVAATGYVSVASMTAAVLAPVAAWLFAEPPVYVAALALVAGLILWRHAPNIRRLVAGNENRFSRSWWK